MLVLSELTLNVNVNSVAPVAAVHSPGLGSAVVVCASASVVGVVGVVAVGAGTTAPPAHPVRIILTTITTVNIDMTNFFIFVYFELNL